MKPMSVSVSINAPAARVFEAVTDLHGAPSRISAIKRMEVLTDGPTRVGTKFRETRVMFGREASETMEITAMEPGRSYVTEAGSHGCRYRSELSVRSEGSGSSLTMTFEGTPLTLGAKVMGAIMGPMMSGSMRKMIEQDLNDIKRAVESGR